MVTAMAGPALSSVPRQWLTASLWRTCLFSQSHQGTDKRLVTSLYSKLQDTKAGSVTAQPAVAEAALDCSKWAGSQAPEPCRVPENLEKLAFWRPEREGSREIEEWEETAL